MFELLPQDQADVVRKPRVRNVERPCDVHPTSLRQLLAVQRAAGNRATGLFVQRKTFWEKVAEEWHAIRRVGLQAIPIGLDAASLEGEVWTATGASGLPGGLNGPQDALRHTYLSALLTALNGNGDAVRGFMANHEQTTGSAASIQSRMDLHNNDVGIRIWGEMSRGDVWQYS